MSILASPHSETYYQPFNLHCLHGTANTKTPAILHSCIKLYTITTQQPTKNNKHPNTPIQAITKIHWHNANEKPVKRNPKKTIWPERLWRWMEAQLRKIACNPARSTPRSLNAISSTSTSLHAIAICPQYHNNKPINATNYASML